MGKFVAPVAPHPFRPHLMRAIKWFDANTERSLQAHIGPSEVGTECMRELGFKLAGTPTSNEDQDHWFAIIGTSVHDWLAAALDTYQKVELGLTNENRRWLIEQRVRIDHDEFGTSGNTDVFDTHEEDVIDYKIVGAKSLKKYRDHGPSVTYRKQLHTYGKGWKQRGYNVKKVTIVFLPRSGFLHTAYIWSEPFDESIADEALARVGAIQKVLNSGVAPQLLPMATKAQCSGDWCNFRRPGPASETGCPGLDG